VTGRDFPIVSRPAARLPLGVAVRDATRRLFVLALLTSLFLFANGSFGASDLPIRSASKSNLPAEAPAVRVLGVRSSSQADYSRVVIDLSASARYKVGHLSNPERVYLDLIETAISPQLTGRRIALNEGIVDQIRMGTYQGSITRIVLDLNAAVRYRVSKLDGPARVLIELSRSENGAGPQESSSTGTDVREASRRTPRSAGWSFPSVLPKSTPSSPSETGNSRAASSSGPQTYGDGEKAGLSYAGTSYPRNVLMLGLTAGSSYNDNIFGTNQQPVGDVDFLFGPSLSLRREGKSLTLALNYQPHFRIYQKASEQNSLDQSLVLDTTYRVSSRLSFRARTSALYTTGIFQSSGNEEFLPGLGSPSGLNETLFTPTVRRLTWSSRVDATYQATAHDSLGLFAGQSTLDFKQQIPSAGNLQNTRDREAGFLFTHRFSPHTTLGANYLLQDLRFGLDSRTLVHSAFLSYAQQLSPSLSLSLFGGPQHSSLHDLVLLPLGPFTFQILVFHASWNWAIGGTLTKQLDKTAFQFSAQHQVSNGGGLIGAVVSSSAGTSVRRRLPGRWDATLSAGYANNSNLESAFSQGTYQSLTAGGGLEHSLTEKLSLRMRYDFLHQRGTGQSPLFGNFDRNLWSLELYYRFDQFVLGR
jgi:hypothetical protein